MSESRKQFSNQPDCTDAVRRLRAIARQIEVFFDMQMRKLNDAASQLNEMCSENDAALRLSADLEQQRRLWEQDRDLESQRLIDAGEKLALAWQELEEKQREIPKRRRAPEPPRPQSVEASKPKQQPVVADNNETTLFEMKMLQQQVAEHARRHNR